MNELSVYSGSDSSFVLSAKDKDGFAIGLQSANLFGVSKVIDGRLSILETDLPNGVITIKLEGTTPIKVGSYVFRVQVLTTDGDSLSGPEIKLNVL